MQGNQFYRPNNKTTCLAEDVEWKFYFRKVTNFFLLKKFVFHVTSDLFYLRNKSMYNNWNDTWKFEIRLFFLMFQFLSSLNRQDFHEQCSSCSDFYNIFTCISFSVAYHSYYKFSFLTSTKDEKIEDSSFWTKVFMKIFLLFHYNPCCTVFVQLVGEMLQN